MADNSNNALNTSDRRLKEHIEPLEYGVDEVLQLQPVSFSWKGSENGKPKLGFIAQDVLKVLPVVVDVPKNPDEYLSIAYSDLIPVLVNAIQEQQTQIEELKAELAELKKLLTQSAEAKSNSGKE